MDIREYLSRASELLSDVVAGQPVNSAPAALEHFAAAEAELAHLAPSWRIIGSLGRGNMTRTPWIAFLDPVETARPTEGLYVVYIVTPDHDGVTLSLNQGVTSVREQLGVARGRDHLRVQSDRIRSELDDSRTSEWDDGIDLSSVGTIQQLYEAGAVLGRAYDFDVLPPAEQLTGDLERLFDLYEAAIDVKRRLLLREPGVILSPTRQPATGDHGDGELAFRPKPDGSYTVVIQGGQRRQSRRHETLVRAFGEACIARGLTVGTNVHPEDAEVRTSSRCWVAEMKTVKPGGELQAVRDAHAQLEMYVDLLHDAVDEPSKVAVFDRPVGDAWVGYLARRGIETVWRESGAWYGTPDATADGLATHALDAGRYALALARPTMARRR